jgi:hypothetical protein
MTSIFTGDRKDEEGAAAGGGLLRCRSSTMAPHRLRRCALQMPVWRSRQSAQVISTRTLTSSEPCALLFHGSGGERFPEAAQSTSAVRGDAFHAL